MLMISTIDVAWTVFSWANEKENSIIRLALGSWCLINLGCAVALCTLRMRLGSTETAQFWIAVIFLIASVIDYIVNREFFFGIGASASASSQKKEAELTVAEKSDG
jgi:hypothetical protein